MHAPSFEPKLYQGFASLPEAYSTVFATGSQNSFFLTRDWFRNFTEHVVSDDSRVRVYAVETESGEPVAALPLVQQPRKSLLAPASLESLSNYYTCRFGPIVRQGEDLDKVAKALAEGLWQDRRGWDVLNIKPMANDSAASEALFRAFSRTGMVLQRYFCFGNWYLEVAGRSYSEYLNSLSSVLRKNIPYNIRRLERSGSNEIRILTTAVGLEAALDDFERVYNASWKHQEATPEFIRGLARISAGNGWLRLGLVYVEGEPAAAQLWIVHGSVASIYKIAYDERFAKLSVGTVLTAKLMERAIDVDKVQVVDYLSGEDAYKKNWMSHRREFGGVLALNPYSLHGLGQIARHLGAGVGKKMFEKFGRKETLERLIRPKQSAGSQASASPLT